ncbi:centrosomal protein of 162 kDa [Denticeps clupeoides]|uniref:centrosomal protein of 162 kDa n=1 Tax=Denticeps clupeoides TaxID=299321 RepID=UPI0010A41E8F|nr:centrosomal protein of 162 kDa [Denticeps clupeoides]XP_028835982.1 centrosomal protein of 162 kDa [Denticeps clupeoides]
MSHRWTKQELDQQFEQFLKESLSDDSMDLGGNSKRPSLLDSLGKPVQKIEKKPSFSKPWRQDYHDSKEDIGKGMLASGRGFRKFQRQPQFNQEVEEGLVKAHEGQDDGEGVVPGIISKDSFQPEDSLMLSIPGLSFQRKTEVVFEDDEMSKKNKVHQSEKSTASPDMSEDFEDEASEREVKKAPQPRMLAKVCFNDSMNSTDGGVGPVDVAETSSNEREPQTTGHSIGHSGTSEMEALQEAYQQIGHSQEEPEVKQQRLSASAEDVAMSPVTMSTPDQAKTTLKPASTNESDLPTSEDLMRAIGPESSYDRGFALMPKCESGGESLIRLSPEVPQEPLSSRDYRRIPEELWRLMQEQEDQQLPPKIPSKAKKQQLSWRRTVFTPTASSLRKAHIPPSKTRTGEHPLLLIASGNSSPSRLRQSAKHSPSLVRQKKNPSFGQTQIIKRGDADVVQNIDAFLHQQLDTGSPQHSSLQDRIRNKCSVDRGAKDSSSPESPRERSSLEQLRLPLTQRDGQHNHQDLQVENSKEIRIQQLENFRLPSKLQQPELKRGRCNLDMAHNPVTEKELQEQETLIQGYQQENEKLYLQLKSLQGQKKCTEKAMFAENQQLRSELAITKEQLWRNNGQTLLGNFGEPGRSITGLLAQVQSAERLEARLHEEALKLRQEKQALQVDLDMMRKERDQAKQQAVHASSDKHIALKLQEDQHKEELIALNKRLQWYAENQELLDRDAAHLRATAFKTQMLTEQVEKQKAELNRKATMQQKTVKQRSAETKQIQDLERQVKELEEILRHRHPNSVPALIYAAVSAASKEVETGKPQTSALLERRLRRLEAELESRDEEAKRSLRAMEQQYHKVKLQYEQQISKLEQQLAEKHQQELSVQEWEIKVSSFQEKTLSQIESHQKRESFLQAELDSLQEKLILQSGASVGTRETEKPHRSPGAMTKKQHHQAETARMVRIEQLTAELTIKSQTIQELNCTIEKLQRERQTLLLNPLQNPAEPKRLLGEIKEPLMKSKEPAGAAIETFPPMQDKKDYHPTFFTGSHISEVVQERDRLKAQLEQERHALQEHAGNLQTELQRMQVHYTQQLESLSASHQRELENLRVHYALHHSDSQVAKLTSQVSSQEIMVRQLRDQVKELQATKEALSVSKQREEILQNELIKILEQLNQAKEMQIPEMCHFSSLEHKIHNIELRYTERERKLQQVIAETLAVVDSEKQGEVERWKRLVQRHRQELETFRLEMDAILDILRELQRQGMVLPGP